MSAEQRFYDGFEYDLEANLPQGVRSVIYATRYEAELLGHQYMQTPHVVLGCLSSPDLQPLFRKKNGETLTLQEGRKGLQELLSQGDYTGGNLIYSQGLKRVMRMVYLRVKERHMDMTREDLLRIVLFDEQSLANNLLQYTGVDMEALQDRLGITPHAA